MKQGKSVLHLTPSKVNTNLKYNYHLQQPVIIQRCRITHNLSMQCYTVMQNEGNIHPYDVTGTAVVDFAFTINATISSRW